MQNRLQVAVVGCGYWGMNYVRVFGELAEAELAAACDESSERLAEVSRRYPSTQLYQDFEQVLHDNRVEAVIVSTGASSHFDLAARAIDHGKHVLIEKPMALRSEESIQLSRLADSKSTVLMVGHTFVYNPGVRALKNCLDGSQIYYMHACRTNLGPIRRDVNAIWDLATHDIAIFNFLTDSRPLWVNAVGHKVLRNCREDVAFISLGYAKNIMGHVHVSWADPNKARAVVVVCGDKRIVFDDLNGLEKVRVFDKGIHPVLSEPESYGEYQLKVRDGDILSPRIEVREPLKDECRHFLQCIQEGSQPATDGWSGVTVLQVLEAIDESVRQNGTRIEVNYHDESRPQLAERAVARSAGALS